VPIKVLVEEPEEKRPLGRSRRRWRDNMTICIQERGWVVGTGLSISGQRKLVCCFEDTNESSGSIKRREFLDWLRTAGCSRRVLFYGVS